MTVQVLVRDTTLAITGVLRGWSSLTCTRMLNAAGTWSLSVVATPDVVSLLSPGSGIVILRDGVVFASGPIDVPAFSRGGARDGNDASPGTLKVQGSTDLVSLAERVMYPDPTQKSTAQTSVAEYIRSGPAAGVIQDLVNVNAGPGALPDRRVPGLVVATGSVEGATVRVAGRYGVLTDELRLLAQAGGGLVFDVAQAATANRLGQSLVFSVVGSRDLSTTARFSVDVGNLRGIAFSDQAPTVTRAIVAGQGVGVQRNILEFAAPAVESRWGRRVEVFIDQRNTNNVTQLTQAGQQSLAGGAGSVQLSSTTVDSPFLRFGADDPANGITGYGLGDRVSISPFPGSAVTDLVRQVTLDVSVAGADVVTALVGSPDVTTLPSSLRAIRNLEHRISHLERNNV